MGGKGARRRERNQRRAAEEKARHPALQAKRQRGGADDRVGAPDLPPPIQCGRGLTPRAPLREGRPPPGTCAAAAATAGRTARWSA